MTDEETEAGHVPHDMQTDEQDDETNTPDEMTEQIEASFGPMSVYVSGTDPDDVQETFESVWETVMDTYNHTHELKQESDDESAGTPGRHVQ